MLRSTLRLAVTSLLLASGTAACDAGASPAVDTGGDALDQATAALGDTSVQDSGPEDTAEDIEIKYPGYHCQANTECSTGLCYGSATKQGVFEPASCQLACLPPMDFANYCNSDDDCCKGRCCLGCGEREGLCILDP